MSARILDGKKFAETFRTQLKEKVAGFVTTGRRAPHISVILVGNSAPSEVYVKNKIKACEAVGITTDLTRLGEDIAEETLLEQIARLNRDENVDGILVQLPLPRHIDPHKLLLMIGPEKDVDGFHPENMGLLTLKMPGLEPATPKGVMMMLDYYVGDVMGMHAVVVGSSNIVGRPMLLELLNRRATVTVCHSKTKNLTEITQQADLLVAAVGVPHFIKAEHVKAGVIVVDVGINRLPDGRLVGDVDFDAVFPIASWISPVPGGVGPMTIAGLLDNTIRAYMQRTQKK